MLFAYARLYRLYKLPLVGLVRVLFLIGVVAWLFLDWQVNTLPKLPLFFLSLFLISEVIYRFKLRKTKPTVSVSKNTGNVYESYTFQSIDALYFAHKTENVLKHLLSKRHIQFILEKTDIQPKEVPIIEVDKEVLAKQAFDITKEVGGTFVTRMDIFAAYMMLIEPQTHLLFNKKLKTDEFLHILYWARIEYSHEEFPPQEKIIFWGEGVFDSITEGWTVETQKYISDLTYKVLDEKPVLLGRRIEFQQMIDTLSKQRKNSVLLIGETGTGKTSLVEALALNSYLGFLSNSLYHQRVYELLIGPLISGASDKGILEERLEAIFDEVSHAGNIILFIQELQNVLGSSAFNIDLSGALLPHLRSGRIRLIAGVTPGAYKRFVEPQQSFNEVFESVKLEDISRDEAIQMLLEHANRLENKEKVVITFKAVIASVDLATRFMSDRSLPGSAVSLLSSVVATVAGGKKKIVEEADIIAKIEQKTHVAIATPGKEEKELLLNLEQSLHKRVIGQDEAVNAIAQAIRRVRTGMSSQTRPISFLFLGPTGVGKTETAKALASIYFGREDKTIRLDMSEYTSNDSIDILLGAEPNSFTEKVYDQPFSLILLDEFEKASPEVRDLFLQVLEDGRLTDNHGKKVSFANTIIIATSNAGALYIQDQLTQGKSIDKSFQQGLLHELEQEHIFKPELLNRFDGIIVFKPLTQEEIQEIAKLYLQKMQQQLLQQDIHVSFDQRLLAYIARQGFDARFGARPLRRFIQDTIEDTISKYMLESKITRGSNVLISVGDNGQIQVITQ